jgi:ankyrin repeat protein
LHFACDNVHTEVVSLLVAAGASVRCTDVSGQTPLMCVKSTSGSIAGIVALLEAAEKRERARDKDGPAH